MVSRLNPEYKNWQNTFREFSIIFQESHSFKSLTIPKTKDFFSKKWVKQISFIKEASQKLLLLLNP